MPSLVLAPRTVLPSSAMISAAASASPAITWPLSQDPNPVATASASSSRSSRRKVDGDGGTRRPHAGDTAHPAPPGHPMAHQPPTR